MRRTWIVFMSLAVLAACGKGASTALPAGPRAFAAPAASASIPVLTIVPSRTSFDSPTNRNGHGTPASFTIRVLGQNVTSSLATVTIYAPPSVVTPLSRTVAFGTSGAKARFRYTGAYFGNPMTVTAVAGTASMTAQLFPQKARACIVPPHSPVFSVAQGNGLKPGAAGGLHVMASVAGSRLQIVQLDTGSEGLIIAKSVLKSADRKLLVGPGQAGEETLEPSGNIESGRYYLAPVTIANLNGKTIAQTVPMEVLIVDKVCKTIGGCVPATGVGLMGIGFGRPTPPPDEPFLRGPLESALMQLQDAVQGTMHRGYVLSRRHLWIGLNRSAVAGFSRIMLRADAQRAGDWSTPPGCVSFNGGSYQCGTMLLDIGIDSMILRNFSTPSPVTSIAIAEPNAAKPLLQYSFAYPLTPRATPPAPNDAGGDGVLFETTAKGIEANTGRNPLAIVDYLYDAACGRVGFKPAPSAAGS